MTDVSVNFRVVKIRGSPVERRILKWCTLDTFYSFYWEITKAGKRQRDI